MADSDTAPAPLCAFDLPWPWAGERFELRLTAAVTCITGPLGSGKTRLARALADAWPGARFVGLERLEAVEATRRAVAADPALAARVADALAWLADHGADDSDALFALIAELERDPSAPLVVDMIEQDLDEPAQTAAAAWLRRRARGAAPLVFLTRSSAIFDPARATADQAAIYCPANHAPPFAVALAPGGRGYESLTDCLAAPAARARTAGMRAVMG